MSGLPVRKSFANFARLAIQPKTRGTLNFAKYDTGVIRELLYITTPRDTRYNDELPASTAKFSPFEELSGIPSTRPEIISVAEFKPLFNANNQSYTPAGEFLDAQVKLMNLRHEAVSKLVNDLKKNPDLAEKLDQIEGNFLKHVNNLKSHADFLGILQQYIERISKLFDLRDSGTRIDAASLLGQYYTSVYSNIVDAKLSLPVYTYTDLLGQHGYNKTNVLGFSSTKIFIQTLFEARKMLRAGSDDLIGVDPSLTLRDKDASTINRRKYKDLHVILGKLDGFPTFANLAERRIYESDNQLTSYLQELETAFRDIDEAYAGVSSDEIAYTLKIRTLTRECVYSNALADPAVLSLLSQYGYPVNATLGNQQLFDAVYGQLGNRITDDRSNTNTNSLSSIASRLTKDTAVLTYEVDYLEDDQGSVFTPGAPFYVASTVRPGDNGFSIENASELITRMTNVVEKYVDFVGKFNILPKTGNVLVSQDARVRLAFDASTMTETLYGIFVNPANGLLKDDVNGSPIVDLLAEAATHPQLRANLYAFMCIASDTAADNKGSNKTDQVNLDLKKEAGRLPGRAGVTIDKLAKNCANYYRQITGDSAAAIQVENNLKNYESQGPLPRCIAYVRILKNVYKQTLVENKTRYSHLSDNMMIALAVQSIFDSARRYAYTSIRKNTAVMINTNFAKYGDASSAFIQHIVPVANTTSREVSVKSSVKSSGRVNIVSPIAKNIFTGNFISKSPLKQAIITRLTREDDLTIRTALAPLNAIRVLRDSLKDYIVFLQRPASTKVINAVLEIVGDRKLVELLSDRGQVQLLINTVDSILDRVNPDRAANTGTDLSDEVSLTRSASADDDLKIFDDSFITSRTANVLKAVFSNAKFSIARGSNIRVLTFGLPHGFSSRLKNKFKISSFAEQVQKKLKQNDVVIADVYRIDVRYPDLIFKPVPKIFELSRFPNRDEKTFARASVGTKLSDALDSVGTRDYSNFDPEPISFQNRQNKSSKKPAYSFMSDVDYVEMQRNHVMSYMLELYFRLLTGIPLNERELYVEDPNEKDQPIPFVSRAILANTAEKIFKVPTPPPPPPAPPTTLSGIFGSMTSQLSEMTDEVFATLVFVPNEAQQAARAKAKAIAAAAAAAAAAADLAKKKTVYVDHTVAGKYMMSPKLFERVFFVHVDPDEFEIDHVETFKSETGRSTFAQLQQAGEIVTVSERVGNSTRDSFKLRDHTTEKQMIFEKFFIVVRSYSPLSTRST